MELKFDFINIKNQAKPLVCAIILLVLPLNLPILFKFKKTLRLQGQCQIYIRVHAILWVRVLKFAMLVMLNSNLSYLKENEFKERSSRI